MNPLSVIVGILTGIISGLGVGGGSLLVLYLTAVAGIEQHQAGGINLLYFIGCAPTALIGHIKNNQVDVNVAAWCVLGGLLTAVPFSLLAQRLDANLLRRLFGLLILFVAYREWKQSTTESQ